MTDNFSYLLPFIFFVFGSVFVLAGSLGSPSSRLWGYGYISAAFAFLVPILVGGRVPDAVSAMLAEIGFLTAYFCYGHALLLRFGLPLMLPLRVSMLGFAWIILAYVIFGQGNLRNEMLVSDLTCGLLLAIPLCLSWHAARTTIDRLLLVMAGLVAMDGLSRFCGTLILTTTGTYPTLESFFASGYAYFTQVSASVIGFLMAMTVLGVIVSDIISKHRMAAEHDPLTDLLNRRGFEQALPVAKRGDFPAGAVIIGDIDHFKQVNDRFGHAVGDHVIIGFANALRRCFGSSALIARFGGEEFVTYLPAASKTDAARIAEYLRLSFSDMDWEQYGVGTPITASFGISTTAPGDHSIHEAIARADACLYTAKNSGRNKVVTEGQRPPDAQPPLRVVS